jgi:2-phosphoglycolate phosphatase
VSERKIGVLFDLDGTLADTAPDLAAALNATLRHFGVEELPYETIRPHVSHGGIALIRLGFRIEPDHPEFETYKQFLLDYYNDNICKLTCLFDGMGPLLEHLEAHSIPWGVVTNKPSWLTDPLMHAMKLTERAFSIVSGDTCTQKKPHPEPILFACSQGNLDPQDCYYVGDAERDIQAGRAAGCKTVTALFGYIDDGEQPEKWQADYSINHPSEIIAILQQD